ncbi:MAG: Crp/Fnr family transcriptional regulator [Sporichthyaceae bacterium]
MDDILPLCADLPVGRFAPGETLMTEGSPSGAIYVLVSGTVGIEVGGVLVKRVSDPGAFLGEISVLLGTVHSARVYAIDDVVTRVLPATEALDNPALLLGMARLLAARLQSMTGYLADLRHQYSDSETHLGLMAEVLSELQSVRPSGASLGSNREDQPDY